MGRLLRDSLASRDVEAELVADPSMPTGAILVVREEGERSMVADRGANAGLSPTDIPDVLAAGVVLVSGYLLFHRGSEAAALAALERAEAPLIAVEASSWPLIETYGADRFLAATKRATMLLANEREAQSLTGSTGDRAIDQLAGNYDVVVVKKGARGAVAAANGTKLKATSPEVVEADPTGAGDAFDGVLLAELARGSDLRAAMAEACLAGARSATSLDTWPER